MGFGASSQKSNQQSQQTSQSSNQAYPAIQQSFSDSANLTKSSSNAIADLLGLNGSTGQDAGFQKFKDSSGYDFIKQEGLSGITANNAARGALGSGDTFKSAMKYSSGLASNFLNSYLQQLMGLSDTGVKSGQLLAGAGNTSNSQGTSTGNSSGSSFNASFG